MKNFSCAANAKICLDPQIHDFDFPKFDVQLEPNAILFDINHLNVIFKLLSYKKLNNRSKILLLDNLRSIIQSISSKAVAFESF